jgi:H+/gluconate symporter-like permease
MQFKRKQKQSLSFLFSVIKGASFNVTVPHPRNIGLCIHRSHFNKQLLSTYSCIALIGIIFIGPGENYQRNPKNLGIYRRRKMRVGQTQEGLFSHSITGSCFSSSKSGLKLPSCIVAILLLSNFTCLVPTTAVFLQQLQNFNKRGSDVCNIFRSWTILN